jgi:hypothetical protein
MREVNNVNNIISLLEFKRLGEGEKLEALRNFIITVKDVESVGRKSFIKFANMYHYLPEDAKNEVIRVIGVKIEVLERENERYKPIVDRFIDSNPERYYMNPEPYIEGLQEKISSNCKLITEFRNICYLTSLIENYPYKQIK